MSCGDQILELFQSLLPNVQCISSELCIKQFKSSCHHQPWSDADPGYWQPFIKSRDGSIVTCHVTRVWSHAPRASRVESPQSTPDGPAQTQAFSIQSSFGNIKVLWYKIGRWCNSVKFKMSDPMFWWNLGCLASINADHCNILWFSIKFPGCSVRFIGDHNCVTPHCFPQIESEEEFSSDQDRPARYLLDKLPGNLTDYAIITHKIKITCLYFFVSWSQKYAVNSFHTYSLCE